MTLPRIIGVAVLGAALLAPAFAAPAPADAAPVPLLTSHASILEPSLVARAKLSADHLAPGSASGAQATPANGRKDPWPGQVIPGFSAMHENRDGSFLAMPDNGFGAKTNSADFLLRIYRITPQWEKRGGGAGSVKVDSFIQLRDPHRRAGFAIVNEKTRDRLLTGADFDIESLVVQPDGTFWVGEEFGPYLLHFDCRGVLLEAPVPFVGGMSPQNPHLPAGHTPQIRPSKGFEAMVGTRDGRYLYPILEGYRVDATDKRDRVIHQFDTRTRRYTGRTWTYRADWDDALVGDAFAVTDSRFYVLERDDFWGPRSVTKRIYQVDLDKREPDGALAKTLVVDALRIDNRHHIGMTSDAGAYGVSDPFSLPVQSLETVLVLRNGNMLLANDTNYPGNDARYPGRPDDTELVVLEAAFNKDALPSRQSPHAVIAHRGASGYRPEHTLAAYETAINQCADHIEPDLVSTKDGVLVDRHENEISSTTDVATRPEFASRRTTKVIDGESLTGWFTEDFTLAELKTLRAVERLPQLRPGNKAYDGLYQVPTFAEVVDLARHSRSCSGKPIGIVPEIKHGSYFAGIGLPQEDKTLAELTRGGFGSRKAPAVIQSFEVANLKYLRSKSSVRLVQLIDCGGGPADLPGVTYAQMTTREGMRDIARYADQVGMCKNVMIPRKADGSLGTPTPVIKDAHAAGLRVVGWTFRAENSFLPTNFRSSADPAALGDMKGEVKAFLAAGMDDFFTDQPDLGVAAVQRR